MGKANAYTAAGANLIGRTIVGFRNMTDKEMAACGWEDSIGTCREGVCLELSDGNILIPRCDEEGNGPGMLGDLQQGDSALLLPPTERQANAAKQSAKNSLERWKVFASQVASILDNLYKAGGEDHDDESFEANRSIIAAWEQLRSVRMPDRTDMVGV
jgi:hypothetical protein